MLCSRVNLYHLHGSTWACTSNFAGSSLIRSKKGLGSGSEIKAGKGDRELLEVLPSLPPPSWSWQSLPNPVSIPFLSLPRFCPHLIPTCQSFSGSRWCAAVTTHWPAVQNVKSHFMVTLKLAVHSGGAVNPLNCYLYPLSIKVELKVDYMGSHKGSDQIKIKHSGL